MSNYTKSTNFATKDNLAAGNALKRVKGAEIDDEFNSLATAIATKADSNNTALTGVPTAPTASSGTSTTQIATTAFAQGAGFVAGTVMVFHQVAAPTGWTKVTTHNDKALRVVSGDGGGSGGSTAFSSAFTHSHSASFSVNNHTLTVSQMPSHTHTLGYDDNAWPDSSGDNAENQLWNSIRGPDEYRTTSSAGGNAGHNHGLSGSVTSQTIAPHYVDVIICSKN